MITDVQHVKDLYFYVTGAFSTDFIFDFETIAVENEHKLKIYKYISENYHKLQVLRPSASLVSGMVDNFSSPKVSSFLSLNITDTFPSNEILVKINEETTVICEMQDIFVDIYNFNCGILRFILKIPQEYKSNMEILKKIRFFIQRHENPEFKVDMEDTFSKKIEEIKKTLKEAVENVDAPLLKTPFLDFTDINEEIKTQLFWSHATLVVLTERNYNPEEISKRFHQVLLNNNPDGIKNFSLSPNIFAFVESGDSLICLSDVKDELGRDIKDIIFEDWIQWIAIHHYTWKLSWELDRGFFIILNLVVSHLKNKRTSKYKDVNAVSALINHIRLIIDTHKPRNMTSTYYSIYFMEQISKSWRTDEILEGAQEKMDRLRDLIKQLDELETERRSRRVDLFLNLIGIFALGSLVLDFIQSLDATETLSDTIIFSLALGVPVIFAIFMYLLLKR
jgi:hypothetical protein